MQVGEMIRRSHQRQGGANSEALAIKNSVRVEATGKPEAFLSPHSGGRLRRLRRIPSTATGSSRRAPSRAEGLQLGRESGALDGWDARQGRGSLNKLQSAAMKEEGQDGPILFAHALCASGSGCLRFRNDSVDGDCWDGCHGWVARMVGANAYSDGQLLAERYRLANQHGALKVGGPTDGSVVF